MKFVLGIVALIIGILVGESAYRFTVITKSVCNVGTFVSGLFLLDIVFPFLYILCAGNIRDIWYFPVLSMTDFALAFFVLSLGYSIFIACFNVMLSKNKTNYYDRNSLDRYRYAYEIKKMVWFCIVLYLLGIAIDVLCLGGLKPYYKLAMSRAVNSVVVYPSNVLRYIRYLCGFCLTPSIVSSAVYLCYEKKLIKKMIMMMITVFICLTTLSRGTLINYFIAIIVILESKGCSYSSTKRKEKIIFLCAILGFIIFTGVRGVMTSNYWGDASYLGVDPISYAFSQLFLSTGASLYGVARICHHLRGGGEIFWGISIWEMFYRFIPRSIWVEKPIQYGIQTINVFLGTPETTMDAITPVGELVANFDYFGMVIMPVYGVLAASFENRRTKGIYTYLYAGFIFPIITTTVWMGSTGLMSNLISMVFFYILFKIYIKIPKIRIDLIRAK